MLTYKATITEAMWFREAGNEYNTSVKYLRVYLDTKLHVWACRKAMGYIHQASEHQWPAEVASGKFSSAVTEAMRSTAIDAMEVKSGMPPMCYNTISM